MNLSKYLLHDTMYCIFKITDNCDVTNLNYCLIVYIHKTIKTRKKKYSMKCWIDIHVIKHNLIR